MKRVVCKLGDKKIRKVGLHNYSIIRVLGGWVKEYVFKMENKIKRFLYKDEVIHHVDCDKDNNNIDNLVVLTKSWHQSLHNRNVKLKKISNIMSKNSCKEYGKRNLIHPDGYRHARVFGGWVPEHMYIVELSLKRTLRPGEVIHHRDENKLNNSSDNLVIMNYNEHQKMHQLKRMKKIPRKVLREHYNKTLKQWHKIHKNPNLGLKRSEESKQKMSEAAKRRWKDIPRKQKIARSKEEVRQIKSAMAKLSWQDPKVRKLRIERLKEVCNTPRVRALHSKAAQIRWGKE